MPVLVGVYEVGLEPVLVQVVQHTHTHTHSHMSTHGLPWAGCPTLVFPILCTLEGSYLGTELTPCITEGFYDPCNVNH